MVSDRELERIYKAVANRRRIAILRLLKGVTRSNVGDIARTIKLSLKSTSRHLQVLVSAGFVVADQQSLYVFYKLEPQSDHITRIVKSL